jgi:uncharacterized protein (TIGR02246 family)
VPADVAYILHQYAERLAAHDSFLREDEIAVVRLYQRLLEGWNNRHAEDMAAPFAEESEMIGFDGSEASGRAEVQAHLAPIFAHHKTPQYYASIKSVQLLTADAAILRAYAGLVPEGAADLDPKLTAQHALTAVKRDGIWSIALFQNTPAQFHLEPERKAQINEELRKLIR